MGSHTPVFSGLLPHPPIVVPEVGKERLAECQATFAACTELAERLVSARPDRLLLVSPHSPRRGGAFGIFQGERLAGDLGQFRAPEAAVELANDLEAVQCLREAAQGLGLETWDIPPQPLDHGAVVPLRFVTQAGFSGQACVLSLPAVVDDENLITLGRAIAETLDILGGRFALIASGDMSHRVKPGAPGGFHPRGVEFDHEVRDCLVGGNLRELTRIDPDLRDDAGEDVIDSTTVVAAALGFRNDGMSVLSYEHPFGVGYLVAVLRAESIAIDCPGLSLLPALAREAITAHIEDRSPSLPDAAGGLRRSAAVFVTLKRLDGSLRGCMGSLRPLFSDLVTETADRAVTAAFRDPRFPPLTADELNDLKIEVSVLGPHESVDSLSELDPRRFGVIVTDETDRRGVLLPDIEGVDTVSSQIAIARRKAGIPDGQEVRIQRFQVEKAREEPERGA